MRTEWSSNLKERRFGTFPLESVFIVKFREDEFVARFGWSFPKRNPKSSWQAFLMEKIASCYPKQSLSPFASNFPGKTLGDFSQLGFFRSKKPWKKVWFVEVWRKKSTPLKTNSSHLKIGQNQEETNAVFQPSIFRCENAVQARSNLSKDKKIPAPGSSCTSAFLAPSVWLKCVSASKISSSSSAGNSSWWGFKFVDVHHLTNLWLLIATFLLGVWLVCLLGVFFCALGSSILWNWVCNSAT